MSDIFLLVFTDTHFLSAFFQTVIIIFLGFLFMRAGIVDSAGKKTITALIWKLSECIKDKLSWVIALLRNIAGPVFVATTCFFIHKTGLYSFSEFSMISIVVGFSAPVSVSLSIMCVQAKKEELLATRACLISTLLTLITFPMSFVLCHMYLQWM